MKYNNISTPLIYIANAAGNYIKERNINTVALFGTRYTMTKPFYKDKLKMILELMLSFQILYSRIILTESFMRNYALG